MANTPFERNRYNPVRDVTSDEAQRDKRQQAEQEAAIRDPATKEGNVPAVDSGKATG